MIGQFPVPKQPGYNVLIEAAKILSLEAAKRFGDGSGFSESYMMSAKACLDLASNL